MARALAVVGVHPAGDPAGPATFTLGRLRVVVTSARAAADPALTFELLEALGTPRLQRLDGRASF